jgi:large subunit ribosomal protein L17
MFRNMITSLFKHERIRTTDVKAKELRRWADNLITLAKRGDLHARRQALAIVREKDVVSKLFEEVSDKYGAVSGGYTRIIKLGRRPGDAAPISMVELIATEKSKKKKKTKRRKKVKATPEQKKTVKKIEDKVAPATEQPEDKTIAAGPEASEEDGQEEVRPEEQTTAADASGTSETDEADTKGPEGEKRG